MAEEQNSFWFFAPSRQNHLLHEIQVHKIDLIITVYRSD